MTPTGGPSHHTAHSEIIKASLNLENSQPYRAEPQVAYPLSNGEDPTNASSHIFSQRVPLPRQASQDEPMQVSEGTPADYHYLRLKNKELQGQVALLEQQLEIEKLKVKLVRRTRCTSCHNVRGRKNPTSA